MQDNIARLNATVSQLVHMSRVQAVELEALTKRTQVLEATSSTHPDLLSSRRMPMMEKADGSDENSDGPTQPQMRARSGTPSDDVAPENTTSTSPTAPTTSVDIGEGASAVQCAATAEPRPSLKRAVKIKKCASTCT
jgi:hypothetical protein